jgi:hypothetical protein
VISPPEQVVELEFVDFDIPCETALIAVSGYPFVIFKLF